MFTSFNNLLLILIHRVSNIKKKPFLMEIILKQNCCTHLCCYSPHTDGALCFFCIIGAEKTLEKKTKKIASQMSLAWSF